MSDCSALFNVQSQTGHRDTHNFQAPGDFLSGSDEGSSPFFFYQTAEAVCGVAPLSLGTIKVNLKIQSFLPLVWSERGPSLFTACKKFSGSGLCRIQIIQNTSPSLLNKNTGADVKVGLCHSTEIQIRFGSFTGLGFRLSLYCFHTILVNSNK